MQKHLLVCVAYGLVFLLAGCSTTSAGLGKIGSFADALTSVIKSDFQRSDPQPDVYDVFACNRLLNAETSKVMSSFNLDALAYAKYRINSGQIDADPLLEEFELQIETAIAKVMDSTACKPLS